MAILTLADSGRGGETTSMAIGYPEPGGLCGNGNMRCCGSCDELVVIAEGTCLLIDRAGGSGPRCLSVEGPASDCSEHDVVRFELDVRLTEGGDGSAGAGRGCSEYLTIDCFSTHSAVRSLLELREPECDGCSMLVRCGSS